MKPHPRPHPVGAVAAGPVLPRPAKGYDFIGGVLTFVVLYRASKNPIH